MTDAPRTVNDILDMLDRRAQAQPRVSVGAMVESFGTRSHGPALMVPAMIELTPIGALPGLPTAIALIIILFATQILLNRSHLWLPSFVENRSIRSSKLSKAIQSLRPLGRFTDRWFYNRLRFLTRAPFVQIAAAASIALAMTVPFLEFVPFASSAPMGAIAMFGLSLLVRDGLLLMVASGLAMLAIYLVAALIF